MTDEHNLTPGADESREVVSWYVPREQGTEVVHCYVQPQPLPQSVRPGSAQPAAPRKKKRGWVIFVILAAALVLTVGLTALLVSIFSEDDSTPFPDEGNAGSIVDITGGEDCYIPRVTAADGLRMELTAPGEETLTPVEVYQRMSGATVTVLATDARDNTSMGTGILLTEDGYFVTNAHVVAGAVSCMIALDVGVTYEAKLVGYAPGQDIAVLKAVDAEGLTPAEFCDSDYCVVGETTYAIGNPLNLNLRGTFTNGMLSGLEREMELDGNTLTMLQTTAAVNNGNSGGPLINACGQVIGIVTMKMSQNAYGAEASVEGLGFALPTSQVAYVVNDILAYGEFRGIPTFGFTILTEYGEDGSSHVTVRSVELGLGAEAAGVQPGDILLAADGHTIRENWDLLDYRRQLHVGDTVDLTILRDGQELHCFVTLTATK